ncbi:sel1 repeat family protein [Sulfurovum sp. bin170]|uniref:tetratricopeptide repeat protein n=1 Tax=Sulfurovum sp. bin170 TaxID=2695268 RepID=UPI0013DFCE33|nr:tetratricopeptide repeat protein [Sulfurovum sp. bin170]NEW61488.1 sel1 repeat family protein [Sulfurovum sp. bin170]
MKQLITIFIILNIHLLNAKTSIHHEPMQQRFLNLLSAAQKGEHPKVLYDLATIYRDGRVTKINHKKAFHLYHKSALKKFPPSQYQLGMAFRHGIGVKINHERARYWLRKAARNQHKDANIIFKLYYSKKRAIKQHPFTNYQK